MELLLPAVLGYDRVAAESYPVLPLLAGADLPGNVLARFDILWMGFLLYSLLFAIGSLLYYGNQIIGKSHSGTGRFWLPALVFLISLLEEEEKEYWIILDGVWRIFSFREFSSVSFICLSEERDTAGSRGKGLSVW